MDANDQRFWADLIERFVIGKKIGPYEWDDYLNLKSTVPLVTSVQRACADVHLLYPSNDGYCSEEGMKVLLELASKLKISPQAAEEWIRSFHSRL